MSTRAQIKCKNSEDNIYIYKHSDGYPKGVLPVLEKFVHDFVKERGDDEPYFLAQLIRHFAIADYKREKNDHSSPYGTSGFLGWGLDCKEHGDIEYLYEVDLKTGEIFINGELHKSVPANVLKLKKA